MLMQMRVVYTNAFRKPPSVDVKVYTKFWVGLRGFYSILLEHKLRGGEWMKMKRNAFNNYVAYK